MGIGVSLILIAIGLILAVAVDAEVSGLDVQVVGWILVAVGAIGALLSLVVFDSWRGRDRVVREDDPL